MTRLRESSTTSYHTAVRYTSLWQKITEHNICLTFNTDHKSTVTAFQSEQVRLIPIPHYSAYANVVGQNNKAAIISETKWTLIGHNICFLMSFLLEGSESPMWGKKKKKKKVQKKTLNVLTWNVRSHSWRPVGGWIEVIRRLCCPWPLAVLMWPNVVGVAGHGTIPVGLQFTGKHTRAS